MENIQFQNKVITVGNSKAIRIPSYFVKNLNLSYGDEVEVIIKKKTISNEKKLTTSF